MIYNRVYRWFRFCFATVMVCVVINSAMITLRVRLPTGHISRLRMSSDSSISELCEKVQVDTDYVPQSADKIHIRDYYGNFSIALSNSSTLGGCGVRDGEFVDITSASTNSSGGTYSDRSPRRIPRNAFRKRKVLSGSLADLEKRRAGMVRINREPPDPNLQAMYHPGVERVLQRIAVHVVNRSSGRIALLMGRYVNKNKSTTIDDDAITAEIYGAFEFGTSVYDVATGLQESHLLCFENAVRVAENLGLHVVGVAVGSTAAAAKTPKSATNSRKSGAKEGGGSSMWRARHVHLALQVRAACLSIVGSAGQRSESVMDPFMILSVAQEPADGTMAGVQASKAAKDQGQGEAEVKVRVEAFRLSAQALQLHLNGSLPAVPSSKAHIDGDVVQLAVRVRGTGSADDSAEVDSALLCVPVAICTAPVEHATARVGGGSCVQEMQHVFPSMAELQNDPAVAAAARPYLLKLLGTATQPLREEGRPEGHGPQVLTTLNRLCDPQLLLYLGTVMEPAAFKSLCRHLRYAHLDSALHPPLSPPPQGLPLEVLVALEQVRQSLL